ncbi:MAG: hypothetical protein ACE366_07510 [Bradymonadia bacterium]
MSEFAKPDRTVQHQVADDGHSASPTVQMSEGTSAAVAQSKAVIQAMEKGSGGSGNIQLEAMTGGMGEDPQQMANILLGKLHGLLGQAKASQSEDKGTQGLGGDGMAMSDSKGLEGVGSAIAGAMNDAMEAGSAAAAGFDIQKLEDTILEIQTLKQSGDDDALAEATMNIMYAFDGSV